MRVLHVSGAGVSGGGAARATYRLHTGLREAGVDSRVLVGYDDTSDPTVDGTSGVRGRLRQAARRRITKLPLYRYPNRDPEPFSLAWVPERRLAQIRAHDPDIVHLHWVAGGFLRPKTIAAIDVPVVWTLHDMWPFTGGCHVSGTCSKYQDHCMKCPQLGASNKKDLSHQLFNRKKKYLKNKRIHLVAPSSWMKKCAVDSSIFSNNPIRVIHNGLRTDSFYPRDYSYFENEHGISNNKTVVCFGSSYQSKFKGMKLMYEVAESINSLDNIQMICFGAPPPEQLTNLSSVSYIGYLDDTHIKYAYSDADIFIMPSKVESFGQMASESLASGTPVVAFEATGIRDVVDHKHTGYLAEPYKPDDIVNGVKWIGEKSCRINDLNRQARKTAVEKFDINIISQQHINLYKSIV